MYYWKLNKKYDRVQLELQSDSNLLIVAAPVLVGSVCVGSGDILLCTCNGVDSMTLNRHAIIFTVAEIYSNRVEEVVEGIEGKLGLSGGERIGFFEYDVGGHG